MTMTHCTLFFYVVFSESVENNSMMATSQGLVTSEHSIIYLVRWRAAQDRAVTSHRAGGGEVTSLGRRKQNKTLPIMIMYNMKFVAVDTYDIVNVGLRSQMVWKVYLSEKGL